MIPKQFEPFEGDLKIQNESVKANYNEAKEKCMLSGYRLRFMNYLNNRLRNETFENHQELTAKSLEVLISTTIEEFVPGSYRLSFAAYEPNYPYIISRCFDKVLFNINDNVYEWERNVDSLEVDSLEMVLMSGISFPIIISISMYPDFPVTFYQVPEHLQQITQTQYDTYTSVIKKISHYATANGLIQDQTLFCDETLRLGLGIEELPLEQAKFQIRSVLIPIQPININFILTHDIPRFNVGIRIPDFSILPAHTSESILVETDNLIKSFAANKELVEILGSIERNPLESIEAEICGHSLYCELSDESNDEGPKVSVSTANPARRSSMYYWQPWAAEHAPRFLEENKIIHQRYKK